MKIRYSTIVFSQHSIVQLQYNLLTNSISILIPEIYVLQKHDLCIFLYIFLIYFYIYIFLIYFYIYIYISYVFLYIYIFLIYFYIYIYIFLIYFYISISYICLSFHIYIYIFLIFVQQLYHFIFVYQLYISIYLFLIFVYQLYHFIFVYQLYHLEKQNRIICYRIVSRVSRHELCLIGPKLRFFRLPIIAEFCTKCRLISVNFWNTSDYRNVPSV